MLFSFAWELSLSLESKHNIPPDRYERFLRALDGADEQKRARVLPHLTHPRDVRPEPHRFAIYCRDMSGCYERQYARYDTCSAFIYSRFHNAEVEAFVDHGMPGEGLLELGRRVVDHRFDAIVVTHLDQISTYQPQLIGVLARIHSRRLRLYLAGAQIEHVETEEVRRLYENDWGLEHGPEHVLSDWWGPRA